MPKERNKADGYREKVPIKREKIDACIDSSEREVSRPKVKAYEGDTKAMNRSTSGRLLPTGRKNLGVCYERGTGVKVSLELAFEWYMKAAELGDVYGCFNVGECYYHGTGVPVDEKKGLKWIHKATFQGYQPAIDYCKEHGYKWY